MKSRGLISTLQSVATNWSGMMALRFFLGVAEAAYGPGIIFYLTFFYLRHEVGFRQGLFLSCAPLATCFAGALAYGITREKGHVAPWRLLFIVEGIPTVLMAPIVWFFLPDSPTKARFLTAEEKEFAANREVRQVGTTERVSGISWKDAGATFLDPKSWMQGMMYFSCNTAYGSLPVFLPTFLETSLGFTAINAQGLTAPPYFLSFLITIATPYIADKTSQRGFMVATLSAIGGIGYILLAAVENKWVRYFGVFLAAGGVFPAIANILPWVTNNQGNDTRRGFAVVILNLVGQCGPLLGTNVYTSNTAPRYIKGHAVCAAFLFFNSIIALTLRTYLSWQNKRMDRKYGTLEEQQTRLALAAQGGADGMEKDGPALHLADTKDEKAADANVATEDYGPMFRYIL